MDSPKLAPFVIAITVATVWTSIATAATTDDSLVVDGKRVRPTLVCPDAPRPLDSSSGNVSVCKVVYVPVR